MELALFYKPQEDARRVIAAKGGHIDKLTESGAELLGRIRVGRPRRKVTLISALGGIGIPDPDTYVSLRDPVKFLLGQMLNVPDLDASAEMITTCMLGLEPVVVELHLARTAHPANVMYAVPPENPAFKQKERKLYYDGRLVNSNVTQIEYCGRVGLPRIILNNHLMTPYPSPREAKVTWRISKA